MEVGKLFATLTMQKDQFDRAVKGAGGGFSGLVKVAKAAALAIGAAFLAMAGVGVAAAMKLDGAYDTIRISTGLTGEELKALEDSFKNVARRVPNDIGEVSDAVAELAKRTGLTGQPLEDLAVQLLDLSRITGTDAKANIEGFTRLFASWEIATEDQANTLDVFFRASQKSGIGVDTLRDQVQQFGGPLRQMGFGLEESVAMLSSWERQGIQSEQMLGAMRIAAAKFTKEGKPLQQGLEDIVDRIEDLGPGADATALALEYFGRQGVAVADAIHQGAFAFDDFMDSAASTGDTIAQATADTADFPETWGRLVNALTISIGDMLLPALSAFSQWFLDALPAITAAVSGAFAFIGDIVGGLGDAFSGATSATAPLGDALGFLGGTVVPALSDAGSWLAQHVMPVFGAAFDTMTKTVIPALVSGIGGLIDNVMPALGKIFSWVAENVVPLVEEAFAFLSETVIPALGEAFAWIYENVLPALGEAIGTILEAVLPVLQGAFEVFTTVVLPALAGAFDFLSTTVLPALGAAFDWIRKNILPPIQAAIAFIAEKVLPELKRALGGVIDFVKQHWPTVQRIFEVVGKAIGVAVDLAAKAVKIAFDAIKGVIDFISPILQKVADVLFPAISTAADLLSKGIGAAFDIISGIIEAVVEAMQGAVDTIGKAWEGLVGIFNTVKDAIVGAVKAGFNIVIGLINGLIDLINSIQIHIPFIGVGDIGIGPFDWWGLQIPKIPYLASGTPDWMGGFAMLGERGPELAYLPQHTRVFDAGDTRRLIGGLDRSAPLIGEQNIYGVQPGDVERETNRALRRTALAWSLEGLP